MLPRPLSPVTQTTLGRHWPCGGGNRQVLTKEVVQTCEQAGGACVAEHNGLNKVVRKELMASKITKQGLGETTQWLRALDALPQGPNSDHSTLRTANTL